MKPKRTLLLHMEAKSGDLKPELHAEKVMAPRRAA